MKVSSEITINAPIEKVFEVFADIEKVQDRIDDITKIDIVSSTKSGQGVRWRETRVMFGKEETVEMEMTKATPPNYYLVESESRGTYYRSEYTFTKVSDKETKVTLDFEGQAKSFGAKLMTPLAVMMKGSIKKAFHKDMEDLKKVLES